MCFFNGSVMIHDKEKWHLILTAAGPFRTFTEFPVTQFLETGTDTR